MIIINYVFICFIFGMIFLIIKLGIEVGMFLFFLVGIWFFLVGILVILYFVYKKDV